jgi:hypothetical protein
MPGIPAHKQTIYNECKTPAAQFPYLDTRKVFKECGEGGQCISLSKHHQCKNNYRLH